MAISTVLTPADHPCYWSYKKTDRLELLLVAGSSHAVAILGRVRGLGANNLVAAFDSDNLFGGFSLPLTSQTTDLAIGVDIVFPANAQITLQARLVSSAGVAKKPIQAVVKGNAGDSGFMTLSLYA